MPRRRESTHPWGRMLGPGQCRVVTQKEPVLQWSGQQSPDLRSSVSSCHVIEDGQAGCLGYCGNQRDHIGGACAGGGKATHLRARRFESQVQRHFLLYLGFWQFEFCDVTSLWTKKQLCPSLHQASRRISVSFNLQSHGIRMESPSQKVRPR